MTPSLRELQRSFGRSLLAGGDGDVPSTVVADGIHPEERVAIYRNTFLSTAERALTLTFPAVRRLVGAEFFAGAARIFAIESPPSGADLNAYGESFSGFLERFAPAATLPYLPDVARLEWAVNRALHADEAPAVELTELASIGESDQARLTLVAHPSVSAVSSGYPVDAIWRAVLDGDDRAIAALDLSDGPCHLLVERVGDHVEVSRMDAAAWEFSRALFMGVPLGLAVERHGDLDVAAWLAAHLVAHRFTSWSLTDGTER